MNPWNVEFAKQRNHVAAHKCHVEITRTWTVAVERLVRPKLVSRYRAAAKDDLDSIRRRFVDDANELVKALRVTAEGQLRYTLAHLALSIGLVHRGKDLFG